MIIDHCERMQRWNAYTSAQEAAVLKLQRGLKLNQFLSMLPSDVNTPANRPTLEKLHKEFVQATVTQIAKSLGDVESQVGLKNLLQQLDQIIADSPSRGTQAWRPSYSAPDNQADHDKVALQSTLNTLENETLAKLDSEVAQLSSKISNLGDEVACNAAQIDQKLKLILSLD